MRRNTKSHVTSAVALVAIIAAAGCDVHGVSEPGTLASITVAPNTMIPAATMQQMLAIGRDADGRVIPIEPTWTVAEGGGTITAAGMFTAGTQPGLFPLTVVASVGAVSGRASISVTPGALAFIDITPGPVSLATTTTQLFVAVGRDTWGNVLPFTPTWSIVAGGGAINQDGTFTAGGIAGNYPNTVQASREGVRGFTTVTVTILP